MTHDHHFGPKCGHSGGSPVAIARKSECAIQSGPLNIRKFRLVQSPAARLRYPYKTTGTPSRRAVHKSHGCAFFLVASRRQVHSKTELLCSVCTPSYMCVVRPQKANVRNHLVGTRRSCVSADYRSHLKYKVKQLALRQAIRIWGEVLSSASAMVARLTFYRYDSCPHSLLCARAHAS